jgi:hypothetical protein
VEVAVAANPRPGCLARLPGLRFIQRHGPGWTACWPTIRYHRCPWRG